MALFLELVKTTVWVLLSAIQLAMLARAILSWFVMSENRIVAFLHAVTEPLIYPIRWLFHKMNWASNSPIDIPSFIAFLMISVLTMVMTP